MPKIKLYTFEEFRNKLQALVEDCDQLLAEGKESLRAKPEETTKEKLIRPFLDHLNFDEKHRSPEREIRKVSGDLLGWVDYRLEKSKDTPLALLEAKSVFETRDLWESYHKQIKEYINSYLLSLKFETPVKWIILTNFYEIHILNIYDRAPFY